MNNSKTETVNNPPNNERLSPWRRFMRYTAQAARTGQRPQWFWRPLWFLLFYGDLRTWQIARAEIRAERDGQANE